VYAPEETPAQEVDENVMDVDGTSQDNRKRKAEAPVKRVDPEPTKKKAKAGKYMCADEEMHLFMSFLDTTNLKRSFS
jgi:hypothetical protein